MAFHVERLALTDGTEVLPPANGMTVFIGPNNSGKSALLNELAQRTANYPGTVNPVRWVEDLRVQSDGSGEEFLAWLHTCGVTPRLHRVSGQLLYPGKHQVMGGGISEDGVRTFWKQQSFGEISHLLTSYLTTTDRLQSVSDSQVWDYDLPANHPTQYLFESRDAREEFSKLVEAAFGAPIAINPYEQNLRLRIGRMDLPEGPPPGTPEVRAAYSALPLLNEQGDGFRSFVNILLQTLVRPKPVIVIDEPEAFLHPPQARLLGRFLAERTPSPCQVFVATHSADFLGGVLEANTKPVSLVRISRTDRTSRAKVLQPEAVTDILRTPVLRYSNIISGLFHDGVVLGESQGDCQFYAATFDVLNQGRPSSNLAFLHTSGKAKLADTARRLRECGIPTAVIADLDLLNNFVTAGAAADQLGGSKTDLRADHDTLREEMTSAVSILTNQEAKKEINAVLGQGSGLAAVTAEQTKRISELLKPIKGWNKLKESGMQAVPNGDAHQAAQRMVDYFESIGVFLVPVGELERWVPSLPSGDKNKWITRVFDEGHYLGPRPDLAAFCERISAYLESCRPGPEQG